MMNLSYLNSVDDFIAFNRYHMSHSPAMKKTKYFTIGLVSILLIIGSLIAPPLGDMPRMISIISACLTVPLSFYVYDYINHVVMDFLVRRLIQEGGNKGSLDKHELEIDENGLVERTQVNETRQSWQGVERIVETDDYAFIYISSIAAHVIPKRAILVGDAKAFLVRAKHLWLDANPELTDKAT